MATRKIVVLGNETLRKVSKPVVAFDDALGILLDDMKTTMLEKKALVFLRCKWEFLDVRL